jgi:hypothetical protein
MNKWFGEKESQINIDSVTAFGISLCTRGNKAHEMAEMLYFAHSVALANLQDHIDNVFYDTKACICSVELVNVPQYSDLDAQLLDLAKRHITQFEWNGTVYHGGLSEQEPA